MSNISTFGELIRKLREENNLPIRKVAAAVDIDPSTLSKIERGERFANEQLIGKLSKLFGKSEEELLIDYLADKIAIEISNNRQSDKILKIAELKLKQMRARESKQGNIEF
jgi:transcriptional regulator with XRE-family HTH domain